MGKKIGRKARKKGSGMKVKAKASFTTNVWDDVDGGIEHKDFKVKEGDVIELRGAVLQFYLENGSVTKDLDWTPEQRGGQ